MNIVNYLLSKKSISWIPFLIVIVNCIIRLFTNVSVGMPISEVVNFFFFLYPLGLWSYFQIIYQYFESPYVRSRMNDKVPIYIQHIYIDFIISLLYAVFVFVTYVILFFPIAFQLDTALLFLRFTVSYLIMTAAFHLVLIIKKECKVAFISAYVYLIIIESMDFLFLWKALYPVQYYMIFTLTGVIFTISMMLYCKKEIDKECDIYDALQ